MTVKVKNKKSVERNLGEETIGWVISSCAVVIPIAAMHAVKFLLQV